MQRSEYTRSDSCSDTSKTEQCGRDGPCNKCNPCLICPPCDYRERYDESGAESSCSDLSKLCEDDIRSCRRKKDLCKKKKRSSSSSSSDDSKVNKKKSDCTRCDDLCGSCNKCKSCFCKECSDASRSSVVESLIGDESKNCCLDDIACDKDRKCDERKKSKVSQSGKGKKFIVSFGCKKGHPWAEYNKGDSSVYVNDKNGPVLHLYRGCKYFFCVEQDVKEGCHPKHEFVLTNSPAGGYGSRIIPGGFAPISKGCVCFKVDKCVPHYFFYQDTKNAFAGGLVIVHDE